jgi:outer membrane lipoprotein-sorting protein
MKARVGARLVAFAALALIYGAASAQDPKKAAPANPMGAGNWNQNQTVSKEAAVDGRQLDKKQVELIQKVSSYFNQLPDIKGTFLQTSADNKRNRGKFYMQRPGKFRFDYSPPSKLVIVSDGQYLAIQDFDIKTDNRIPLDETPFRVLLRKDVDLLRDAKIIEVKDIDDIIVLFLEDRSADNPGRIKLFLAKKPNLELREWITTDAQGLDTRIELTEVNKADELDPGLFKPAPVSLQRLVQ